MSSSSVIVPACSAGSVLEGELESLSALVAAARAAFCRAGIEVGFGFTGGLPNAIAAPWRAALDIGATPLESLLSALG